MRFLLVLLAIATPAGAQFYAPDTEFHDLAQRTFPVEAARILAWQRNQVGGKIAEVKFEVATTLQRETHWTLQWLDAAGKLVRERSVRYPETLLLEGPQFFRATFAQIAGEDWTIESAAPDNAATAFWQGAELAGVSRAEALTAAGKLLTEKPKLGRAADASRLAGLLSHGTLPILGNQLTIDGVLLGRAAGWLCVAELRLREKLDAAWGPILFLSGREKMARAISQTMPANRAKKAPGSQRFWEFFLPQPSVKESFLFAAKRENRQFALPAMLYHAQGDEVWGKLMAEVVPDILGGDLAVRHFEYAPSLFPRGEMAGSQFGGNSADRAIGAWIRLIRDFTPGSLDFGGYREALAAAEKGGTDREFFARLPDLAPLVNLAFEESSRGPLIPVAHVTIRDLLGFGWETTGFQIGSRHNLLRDSPESRAEAKAIAQAGLPILKGINPFFLHPEVEPRQPLQDLRRLEGVSSRPVEAALMNRPLGARERPPDLWMRRVWLRKAGGDAQIEAVVRAGASNEAVKALVGRLLLEGGPSAFGHLLAQDPGWSFPKRLDELGLRIAVAHELPLLPQARVTLLDASYREHGDAFRYAQELERFGWEIGTAVNATTVFEKYLEANAVHAAKRYYEQVKEFTTDRATFAKALAPERFALASLERDEASMLRALEESASSNPSNLRLWATAAMIRGDRDETRSVLDALVDRNAGAIAEDQLVRNYLPLIPALADAAHPDHEKALDSFPQLRAWQLFQWALLEHAKLKGAAAIRFLGENKAEIHNQVLIAALRDDRAQFERLFNEYRTKLPPEAVPLVLRLRCELLRIPPPAEEPDLKPNGAKPLAQLIRDAIAGGQREEATQRFDIAAFDSVDKAWAALEALREFKPERVNTPDDQTRRFREWLELRRTAAEAFEKAYSKAPRRWDARLLAIDSAQLLARAGERTGKPLDRNALEEVLAAPDAAAEAKGEAAFLLVTLEMPSVNPNLPHTLPPFHRALSDYLEKYPHHRRAPHAARLQLQLLEAVETPGSDNLLKKLSSHPNREIAGQAKALAEQRTKFAEFKKQPIALKFAASDGSEVDLAKLRGKVVLLDFWASWCGPCIAEAPHVVAAYEKFRERGFAVVGISLDQDRAAMDAAVIKLGMAWPHCFDADRGEHQIAKQFGIRSIPAAWLFDKKGLLRQTGLRGTELHAAIERLLAE